MTRKQRFYFYFIPFGMDFAFLVGFFGLPLLADRLGASISTIGFLGAWGPIVYFFSCLAQSPFQHRIGPQNMALVGAALFAVAFGGMSLVKHVYQMFFVALFYSFGLGMFWPGFQGWLGSLNDRSSLMRRLLTFNLAWTAGFVVGAPTGGILYELDFRAPFLFAAAWGVVIFLLILKIIPNSIGDSLTNHSASDPGGPTRQRQTFLYVGWMSNFIATFNMASVRTLFPKLATSQGIEPRVLGALFFMIYLAQMACFAYLGLTRRWHYNFRTVVVFQLIGVGGMILMALTASPLVVAASFSLLGFSFGLSYFSSLFYSLTGTLSPGKATGIHEAMVGLGACAGPFCGGLIAEWTRNLHAPYALCVVATLGVLVAQGVLIAKNKNDRAKNDVNVLR